MQMNPAQEFNQVFFTIPLAIAWIANIISSCFVYETCSLIRISPDIIQNEEQEKMDKLQFANFTIETPRMDNNLHNNNLRHNDGKIIKEIV